MLTFIIIDFLIIKSCLKESNLNTWWQLFYVPQMYQRWWYDDFFGKRIARWNPYNWKVCRKKATLLFANCPSYIAKDILVKFFAKNFRQIALSKLIGIYLIFPNIAIFCAVCVLPFSLRKKCKIVCVIHWNSYLDWPDHTTKKAGTYYIDGTPIKGS